VEFEDDQVQVQVQQDTAGNTAASTSNEDNDFEVDEENHGDEQPDQQDTAGNIAAGTSNEDDDFEVDEENHGDEHCRWH